MRLIYNMIIGMKICYINISGQTYNLSICAKTVLFLYNSKKSKTNILAIVIVIEMII